MNEKVMKKNVAHTGFEPADLRVISLFLDEWKSDEKKLANKTANRTNRPFLDEWKSDEKKWPILVLNLPTFALLALF